MGQYIKLFQTHADYTAFTSTSDFILPNVSYCEDQTDVIHYNPMPHYAKLYYQGNAVGETEICYDESTGYYGCDDGFYGRQSIAVTSNGQNFDAIEIHMFNGATITSVKRYNNQDIQYVMNGDTFRVDTTIESGVDWYSGFTITYTCKGNVFRTSVLINDMS